jgi:hypothetical protein
MGACPGETGAHAVDTCREVAWRSKPEGVTPAWPASPLTRWFLSLSRLVRCRELPGRTADDAVLTLEILKILPGEALLKSGTSLGTGGSSVDEAAKPDIHHQANRQENKQRSGTPVTH